MKTLHGIEGLRQAPKQAALTIGNFDGVHRGHQLILETCRRHSRTRSCPCVVVTFEPHPLTVLRPEAAAPRLTPAGMKQELIESLGADCYVVLPPDRQVLNLAAEEFWKILRDDVQPSVLVEGPDFTFGKNRAGDVGLLARWAGESNVHFELIEPLSVALLDLSLAAPRSSLIRQLLAWGRVREAAICLGRPYTLRGEVIKGFGRGKTIGVPTANLGVQDQMIPADGVYAGRCRVDGNDYAAAVSIGVMPTFKPAAGATPPRQVEAHLLGFEGDLYGKQLDLQLLDWLREQVKYSSVAELTMQIGKDVTQTRLRIALDPSKPIAAAAGRV